MVHQICPFHYFSMSKIDNSIFLGTQTKSIDAMILSSHSLISENPVGSACKIYPNQSTSHHLHCYHPNLAHCDLQPVFLKQISNSLLWPCSLQYRPNTVTQVILLIHKLDHDIPLPKKTLYFLYPVPHYYFLSFFCSSSLASLLFVELTKYLLRAFEFVVVLAWVVTRITLLFPTSGIQMPPFKMDSYYSMSYYTPEESLPHHKWYYICI